MMPRTSVPVSSLNAATSAVEFVNQMFTQAVHLRASDIHLELYQSTARLRYRLDGMLKEAGTGDFLYAEYSAVMTRIKVLAGLDIAEHRLPQDGRFSFSCEYGKVDLRISILPAVDGARMVLRIMESADVGTDFFGIGMSSVQVDAVHHALSAGQGMILVTGPTGSGKTTTLYTMLNMLNCEERNILTVENPVERRMDGVGQVQVCEEIGLDFSHILRAFLRQDPEVIMVGEIRDFETADIALKASLTGHLVLSTLHTNDAATSIARLTGLGLPAELVGIGVNLVVSQRLLRLVCTNCKRKDSASGEVAVLPDCDSGVDLMYGEGCDKCNHTGYRGRRGVFEILNIGKHLREAISRHGTIQSGADGETMEQSARRSLLNGEISFGEYQRVFGI